MDSDTKYLYEPFRAEGSDNLVFRPVPNPLCTIDPLEGDYDLSNTLDRSLFDMKCEEQSHGRPSSLGAFDKVSVDIRDRILEYVLFPDGEKSAWKQKLNACPHGYSLDRPVLTLYRCTYRDQSELHGFTLSGKNGITEIANVCETFKFEVAAMVYKQSNVHVLTCNRLSSPKRCLRTVFPRMRPEQFHKLEGVVFKFNWNREVMDAFMNNLIIGDARKDIITLQFFCRFIEIKSIWINWIVDLPLFTDNSWAAGMMDTIVKSLFCEPTKVSIHAECHTKWLLKARE